MRILALPVAIALALLIYLPLPKAGTFIAREIQRLYARFLLLFTRKSGKADEEMAFPLFLLLTGGVCQMIGGLHFAAAGAVMTPLFCAFAALPQAVRVKNELDSGALSSNIAEYEARVRSICAQLAPAFSTDLFAPMLLVALGTPIHMGCVLGGAYLAARALCDQYAGARRLVAIINKPVTRVTRAMLLLCSCVVGKNPFHAHGETLRELMLSIQGIAGDVNDSHAPVAGDIAQAVFLLCFAAGFLLFALTAALFSFC